MGRVHAHYPYPFHRNAGGRREERTSGAKARARSTRDTRPLKGRSSTAMHDSGAMHDCGAMHGSGAAHASGDFSFVPLGLAPFFRSLTHGLRPFGKLRAGCGLRSFAALRLAQGGLSRLGRVPRGLKADGGLGGLRGPEGPLFHGGMRL
jgi:hypothetical protein